MMDTPLELILYHNDDVIDYKTTSIVKVQLIAMQHFFFVIQQLSESNNSKADFNFLWTNMYGFRSNMQTMQKIINR